ncbi:MarR family winged helix-turn-helix transcriptional regulator [Jatrophihabitans lederbergiae]|uniref:MarR family transcriptional regulator n=1 Tax=Jatrophihabitans lederbergiae TaxID=3075547 RepID=A0ABU2J753_9ACTN|nr:MarR family transcriptional regulator [Jatrophihabitans sp. DSM 44399]MDT0260819.1 MarR family transcriptional regulator [Jatrophihabitans sp. DSM 44399]
MSAQSAEMTTAELASSLRLSLLRAARRIRSQRVNTTATLSQLSALATVNKCGPLSAGEIAAVERVQPPSMTKILAALEASGWVARASHPDDRRQSIISITDAGRQLMAEETRARDEWLAERLVDFSAEDIQKLRDAVGVLDRLGSE